MRFRLCEDLEHWSDSEIYNYFNYPDLIQMMIDDGYFEDNYSDSMKQLLDKLIDFVDDETIHSYCRDWEIGYPEEEDEYSIVPCQNKDEYKELMDGIDIDYQDTFENILRYLSTDEIRDFYYYAGLNAFAEENVQEMYDEEEIDKETYDKLRTRFINDKNWSVSNLKSKSSSTHQTSKVSFEEVEKSAENFAKSRRGKSDDKTIRGFILRDGFIVSNNALLGNKNDDRHGNADAKIVDAVCKDLNTTVSDVTTAVGMNFSLDANGTNGSLLADCLGWIRVNGGIEQYISLPEKNITTAQKYALADWINSYMLDNKKIKVTTFDGKQVTYIFNGDEKRNIEPYTGEDIANKVMKYYQSGKLEENKEQ